MHIEFDTNNAMAEEIARMMRVLKVPAHDVFYRAFALLLIHVDAAIGGKEIWRMIGNHTVDGQIVLPFEVNSDAR